MSTSNGANHIELELPMELKQNGVGIIEIESNSVLIDYRNTPYRFTLSKHDPDKTFKSFDKCVGTTIVDQKTKQGIIYLISREWTKITGEDNTHSDTKAEWNNEYKNKQVTLDDWKTTLQAKYDYLIDIVKQDFPFLIDGLEFALSIRNILYLKDCSLPFAGILLGNPSSCKTLIIELFRHSPSTFYTDDFSARSFVSHNTAIPKDQLKEIDLLPKIKNKYFLTPELAPMFAKKDEDVIQSLGIITRILDGHGYESDTGAHGHRGYTGELTFVWCGAAVDIPRKIHRYLGTLGPKLYFLRMPKQTKDDSTYLDQLKSNDFNVKFHNTKDALFDYLKWFEICPTATIENGIPKVGWGLDNEEPLEIIVRLGKLLAHLRGVIPTWETHDTQGVDYAYSIATIEEPDRAMTQLRNLARGHALVNGRNQISILDIPLLIKVVLSTASIERVKIFDLLISNGGTLTTSQIKTNLNTTAPTARRTMAELHALELVNMRRLEDENEEYQVNLRDEFDWFLGFDFSAFRTGDITICGSSGS